MSTTSTQNSHVCRACGHSGLVFLRASTIQGTLNSDHFAITDSDYGTTAALYRCPACALTQCPETDDVLKYYQYLEDPAYEEGHAQRLQQSMRLVGTVLGDMKRAHGQGLKLLDVGAGTGNLVEAAQRNGFDAEGVEPSAWLTQQAKAKGLKVHEGVLPHTAAQGPYDVVMLIDVIEHVTDPLALLRNIRAILKPNGRLYMVTPDASSFFARLLGFKWWHYRIAHISYFNLQNLTTLAGRAGFKITATSRPCWYFSYAYLRERLMQYLPSFLVPPAVGPLKRLTIPLNLRDSLLVVCENA
ncbi:MAG: methyltransferase domain-containing protein [Alphaproteobacteria bacterium]|nr:methyltransferase domain-containing protein [Alphaproteobacteria bacterium]